MNNPLTMKKTPAAPASRLTHQNGRRPVSTEMAEMAMQIWNIVTAVASFSWCSRCSVRFVFQLLGLTLNFLLLLGVFPDAFVARGSRFVHARQALQARLSSTRRLDPLGLVERPLVAGLRVG